MEGEIFREERSENRHEIGRTKSESVVVLCSPALSSAKDIVNQPVWEVGIIIGLPPPDTEKKTGE